jgi:hypothetical protein
MAASLSMMPHGGDLIEKISLLPVGFGPMRQDFLFFQRFEGLSILGGFEQNLPLLFRLGFGADHPLRLLHQIGFKFSLVPQVGLDLVGMNGFFGSPAAQRLVVFQMGRLDLFLPFDLQGEFTPCFREIVHPLLFDFLFVFQHFLQPELESFHMKRPLRISAKASTAEITENTESSIKKLKIIVIPSFSVLSVFSVVDFPDERF